MTQNSAEETRSGALRMERGVSQLLFAYTPGRTVDWEDGRAIVQLGEVFFSSVWTPERSAAVFEEASQFRSRWLEQGGEFDELFVDPLTNRERFAVGTPGEIVAHYFNTILICQHCNGLVAPRTAARRAQCNHCGSEALRQFGQVFVHGCGELVPIRDTVPVTGDGDSGVREVQLPLRCRSCGPDAPLTLSARSERVKDLRITCTRCGVAIIDRLKGRCHKCLKRIRAAGTTTDNTVLGRIVMRMSRYSASDTYYPVTVSRLRLDRPQLDAAPNTSLDALRKYLPRPRHTASIADSATAIAERLKAAEQRHDDEEQRRLRQALVDLMMHPTVESPVESRDAASVSPDLRLALEESIAFRTTVDSRPALVIARTADGAAAADDIQKRLERLQICQLDYVSDLPVIAATLGYTRRTFQPTYDEPFAQRLPARVRPFESVSRYSAARAGQAELVGRIPFLAREGEHEGIFFSLKPEAVAAWLSRNNVRLPSGPAVDAILQSLEPTDKYCDRIWECHVRRHVFGLIHTISHLAMCAMSRFAGIERTSIGEYLFLPLLGSVVYDASNSFKLGGVETMIRDHLSTFLASLSSDDAVCLYDPDCIDRSGACHGCIHSPEIACRVFNHGLSRAFLIGGHAPWADAAEREDLVGFWESERWI